MSIRLYFVIICVVFFIGIEGKPVINAKLYQRVNHLLNITDAEKEYYKGLQEEIENIAVFKNHKNETLVFLKKLLPFQSIRPVLIEIYAEYYTLSEINGLIKFYSSPLGKKVNAFESKVEHRIDEFVETKIAELQPQITAWYQETFADELTNNDDDEDHVSFDE
jgi:hypothetical protein